MAPSRPVKKRFRMRAHQPNIDSSVISLSVKERTLVADSVLQSLTPIDSLIEDQWVHVAIKRLEEIQTGKVKPIPGNQVFNEIKNRYTKVKKERLSRIMKCKFINNSKVI